jgi:hypothetical protein
VLVADVGEDSEIGARVAGSTAAAAGAAGTAGAAGAAGVVVAGRGRLAGPDAAGLAWPPQAAASIKARPAVTASRWQRARSNVDRVM